ncbi:MAG: M48 family metalloprotease [Solirubrobacteraceae bacterium]
MSGASVLRSLWPVGVATVAAEGGRRLLTPRAAVPAPARVDLRDHFSEAEIERGRRYARPQLALALGGGALELATLAWLVRHPPRPLARAWRRPVAGAATTTAALSAALVAQGLPLRALARRRALAVGLDTQNWGAWAADGAKAGAIRTGFSAAAGAAVTWIARRHPRDWWAPAAAGWVGFGAALAALAPVLLDPIFNAFTPLPDGETRSDVLALARDAGVALGEVYCVDASRRTSAANAYVSGIGPSRRVVLFDTLLDRYSRDEIRLVVAHELAHVRHRDVLRLLAFVGVASPASALAVQRLSWELSPARATPAALPAVALAAALVTLPLGLIGSRLSRAMERRADHFALTLVGSPDAFVSFERTIALQNLADLDPPRWVARLLATHPPTAERIGAAIAFARATA